MLKLDPFLDGTAMSEGEPLNGARATSAEIRTPANREERCFANSLLDSMEPALSAKRLAGQALLYLWDEPVKEARAALLERGRAAVRVHPPIRNLVTTPFAPALASVVQIWVPLVNCLMVRPGF